MSRTTKAKSLINSRLATNYGGWMYCDKCNTNIGYLCYATYDEIDFNYQCQCGNRGQIHINFIDSEKGQPTTEELTTIKNRLCCNADSSPLITILEKKLVNYELNVTCKSCHKIYQKTKTPLS